MYVQGESPKTYAAFLWTGLSTPRSPERGMKTMSVADEIEKLDALRKQNLISDSDFEKQKQSLLAGEKPRKRRWLRVIVGIVGLILIVHGLSKMSGSSGHASNGEIPKCDSSEAHDLVEGAVEDNPSGAHLRLLDMQVGSEVGYNSINKIRTCRAILTLNSGKEVVNYFLSYSSDGNPLVEVRPCGVNEEYLCQ